MSDPTMDWMIDTDDDIDPADYDNTGDDDTDDDE